MDVEQFKEDVRVGRITTDRLIGLVVSLLEKIDQLERQLGGSATQKCPEPFSVRAEEKRQEARGKKRKRKQRSRGGRKRTAEKVAQAVRTEKVFPAGLAEADCWLSHTRVAFSIVQRADFLFAVLEGHQASQSPGCEVLADLLIATAPMRRLGRKNADCHGVSRGVDPFVDYGKLPGPDPRLAENIFLDRARPQVRIAKSDFGVLENRLKIGG